MPTTRLTSETLCTPPGLLPAEQLEYWRELAHALLAALRAAERDLAPAAKSPALPLIRAAIAKAEGRSDE